MVVEEAQQTTGEVAPVPRSRAGRNLPVATAVGLGLLGAVAVSLYWDERWFLVFVVLALGAALWELAQAFAKRDIHIPLVPLLVGSVGMVVSTYLAGPEALLVSFMLTVGGVVVWRVLDGTGPAALRDVTAGTFAAAYLPFMAGFVVLMLELPDGARRVALFVLLVVASDVGGYATGVALGRHPLAPTVSPKKSWEGLAGSLVLAASVGAVGVYYLFGANPLLGAGLGAAVVAAATLGDLAESMLKRDLGLKDMGSLLPGHGGVLDRLDSVVIAAPVAYIVLLLAIPVGD